MTQAAPQTVDNAEATPRTRAWWQSFAARIMLSSAALSLTVLLISSAFSYNALRDMSLKVANQALEGQARTLRHDIEARVASLSVNLRALSANALIANALADDVGRDVYLRDFISGLSSSEGFDVTVVMTSFRGKTLASNRPNPELLLPPSWVAKVVNRAQGAGHIAINNGVPYLLLAEPIIFRNTGTAEGALIFQVKLDDWLQFEAIQRIFSEAPWLSNLILQENLHPNSVRTAPNAGDTAKVPHVDLALSLPQSINGAALTLGLSAKQEFVQQPLDELLTKVALLSSAIFLAALLGSFFLARRQTRKLTRLRQEANQISQIKSVEISFTSDGQDEVDDLADAFTALVEELHQAYRQLEDESSREIELRERRFQSIINNSAEGIITLSSSGAIETFNPSAERIFDYTAEQVIGHNIAMLMPEADRLAHNQYLKNSDLHAPRIINRARDLLGLRQNGDTFPLELNVSPMELDGEHKFIGIMRDISDRKEFEDRLNAARVEAEQANLAKSQFLSSMSHELRTPLNAILGFGQLLEMDAARSLSKSQGDAVAQILKGGKHLLELIDQVLNLAKIESGNLSVSIENLDVTPSLSDAIAMARNLADKRAITLRQDIPKPGTTFVHADNTRLQQVLLNLLSNATKYNHHGGNISVRCFAKGDVCRFEIEDTGPGIADDLHDQVFAPFNRLGAESGEIEGTGIGLPLPRELIHLMQGTLGFTSTLGNGALFWFELPIASAHAAKQHRQQALDHDAAAPVENATRDSHKILYVEHNPANLELMEMVIERHDHFHKISAHTAEIGIAMAETQQPNLILMDIHLPGMSGLDAMRELRKNPKTATIPIIAVSANAMPKDIAYALDAGFDNYLTKPINIPATLQAIADALET